MRLTQIRLSGFKSFAETTLFPIDAPITGIIGPNGCGKSNIIDAVRWVLGENVAKQLRSQQSTDIIFAGTKTRKPLGLASVSLHFDNHDHKAQGLFNQYKEIIIQRKISSDGQNHYLINQQKCRRKDIVELLQGTGIGARSYSVVEQGIVSRIIESRPEELRQFIEEAAGVALYKTRRKESEKKIEETRNHLERHLDRLQQLQKQKEQLAEEAKKAREHQNLTQEEEQLQKKLLTYQQQTLKNTLIALKTEQNKQTNKLIEQKKQLIVQEKTINTQKQHIDEAQLHYQSALETLREHEQNLQKLNTQHQEQRHQIERLKDKIQDRKTQLSQIEQQLTQSAQNQQNAQEEIQQLLKNLEESEKLKITNQKQLYQAEEAQQQAEKNLQQQEQQIAKQQIEQQERQKHIKELQEQLEINKQHLKNNTSLPLIDPLELEEKHYQLEKLRLEKEHLEEELSTLETQQQHLEQAQQQNETQQLEKERYALEEKQKQLLKWLPKQENKNTKTHSLYKNLEIQASWQNALEKYLSPYLHIQIGDNNDTSSHFALGSAPKKWQHLIKTNADLNPLLAHLTPLETGQTMQENTLYLDQKGAICSHNCYLPMDENNTQNLLTHYNEYQNNQKKLEKIIEEHTKRIANKNALKTQQQTLKQKQQTTKQQLLNKNQNLQKSEIEYQLLEKEQQHQNLRLKEQQQRKQQQQQEIKRLEEKLQHLKNSIKNTPDIDDKHLKTLKENHAEKKAILKALQEKQQQNQAQQQQYALQLERLKSTQQHQNHQQKENNHKKQALIQEIKSQQQTLDTLKKAQQNTESALEKSKTQQQTAQQQKDTQKNLLQQAQQHLEQLKQKAQENKQEIQLQEQNLNHLAQQIAQYEAQKNEQEDDENTITLEKNFDPQQAKNKLKTLAIKIKALGAINFTAILQHQNISEEHQKLHTQCQDISQALALLENAIKQLDRETKKRLENTFNAVQQNFQQLFPKLFRGGEANLHWENDDILNAGILLSARPAGKNIKSLQSLSGGEKALTALALIFALFKLNPAPFCLLDEIDAPLDEGNVTRLGQLLHEISQETQFIIITHHKKTMEYCERLIGVTMSEPGVSRLVSVAFDKDNSHTQNIKT